MRADGSPTSKSTLRQDPISCTVSGLWLWALGRAPLGLTHTMHTDTGLGSASPRWGYGNSVQHDFDELSC